MNPHNPLIFRLLEDGISDPSFHFAVEETILRGVDEGTSPPTLRLRNVIPSVFIGVYQYPEEDVDVAYCQQHHIPIIRRPNPGGAVYQDDGSFCYSLFFLKEPCFTHWHLQQPEQLYAVIGEAVKACCADYGVCAEISPVNDVTIGGRKVYGSAQILWYNAFVHSGSFLVNTHIPTMQQALKPSLLKFADKGFHNVRDRVINLVEAAKQDIPPKEVMFKLAQHLAQQLHLQLEPGELTSLEQETARELYLQKYNTPEWTFRQQPVSTHMVSRKAKSGVIGLSVSLEGETITELSIRGDFLVPDQGKLAELLAQARGKKIEQFENLCHHSLLPPDIRETLIVLWQEIKERTHDHK